jgi:uncharacterized protein (TIGR02466 family)
MKKEIKLEFSAIRPFGPSIVKGKLPTDVIDLVNNKADQLMEDPKLAKKWDWSQNLAGNVKQEVRFPPEWLDKDGQQLVFILGQMTKQFLSLPPASETLAPDKVEKMIVESMWCVSQWAGDFNPAHMHDGDLSGVFYTKMPKSIDKERAAEDHYPSVGDIVWFSGDPKSFNGHKLQESPEVGDIFMFPSWLTHMVYPFRTPNEERRSVSFNIRLVPKGAQLKEFEQP